MTNTRKICEIPIEICKKLGISYNHEDNEYILSHGNVFINLPSDMIIREYITLPGIVMLEYPHQSITLYDNGMMHITTYCTNMRD